VTVVALDIGGTKLTAGTVDGEGNLLERVDAPTPREGEAGDVWAAVAGLLDSLQHASGAIALGCGCGGPMARGGASVSPLNIAAWRGFPLRDRLAEHTGLPVWVDNDAKALALGEGRFGAARGHDHFIGMVVSTGVGGGIVLDGRLLDGADANAGHIGHVVVEPDGRRCACGARGCVEAEASGTAIAAITGRPPAEAPPELRARAGTLVGRAIANVATLLDLDLAVVAGSVALGYGEAFFAAAQAEIDARCRIEFARGTRIVPAQLGRDAPIIGAACVALVRATA
jgi:glucokinase